MEPEPLPKNPSSFKRSTSKNKDASHLLAFTRPPISSEYATFSPSFFEEEDYYDEGPFFDSGSSSSGQCWSCSKCSSLNQPDEKVCFKCLKTKPVNIYIPPPATNSRTRPHSQSAFPAQTPGARDLRFPAPPSAPPHPVALPPPPKRVLAVDCEMVSVISPLSGTLRSNSALARVAVVDSSGLVVFHSYAAPSGRVSDYRTEVSGIRAADLVGAPPFEVVRDGVLRVIAGCKLVGHSLDKDLDVLRIEHDDTACTFEMCKLVGHSLGGRSLKSLVEVHCGGASIQANEHCPIEDARATIEVYKKLEAILSGAAPCPALPPNDRRHTASSAIGRHPVRSNHPHQHAGKGGGGAFG